MRECFPVCLQMLGVKEGEKHTFFEVLKYVPYLAENVVQNISVELVLVSTKVALCWASPCPRCT